MTSTKTEPAAEAPPEQHDEAKVEGDPELVPVTIALGRIARVVTVLRKTRTSEGGKGQPSFKFRGIDDTMNALGPVFRKHGVLCLPEVLSAEHEYVETRSGSRMCTTRVQVAFTFHGPQGDTIRGSAAGEAFDSGDKSTAKAMSVALRTFLLQAFTLPTDEPDPDETREELASGEQQWARAEARGQRRADERQQRQPAQPDPWRVEPLTPDGKTWLAELMATDNADLIRSTWREIKAQPVMHATPHEIGKVHAEALEISGPMTLLDVATKVGEFVAANGISVARYVEDMAALAQEQRKKDGGKV